MRWWLLVFALVAGGHAAAQDDDLKPYERAGAELRAGRLAEAERILASTRPGGLAMAAHSVSLGKVALSYMRKHDYAGAERVSRALVEWAEKQSGAAGLPVVGALMLAGDVARLQSKYREAGAAYGRALEISRARGLANCTLAGRSLTGLGEAYLGLNRYREARNLLQPEIAACDEGMGRAALLNLYAVALELAGEKDLARQAEAEADGAGPGDGRFEQEQRDLLRARLLAADGRTDEAVALCRMWVAVFEVADGAESDRRLVLPLSEWERILHLAGRAGEAAQVGARLAEIRTKYKM